MAKEPKTTTKAKSSTPEITKHPLMLGELLSAKPIYQRFSIWLESNTPLICHGWSHKNKLAMLEKQAKATRAGREARDPHADFVDSLYEMGKDEKGNLIYGFPVTGVKNAILSAAHKDKGVPRSSVLAALWLNADMVRVRPALAGAICDMPLVRIYSGPPEMREDMVRVGVGLTKTASLAYRGQFTHWGIKITGRFNPTVLTAQQLTFLIVESGLSAGLGEWRNEKKGIFGAYHLANPKQQVAWEKYAAGKGPLPKTSIEDDEEYEAA